MPDQLGLQTAHFNVNCVEVMMAAAPASFEWLRFDSNDNCNLHCVYCHNSRSQGRLDLETFVRFLDENVIEICNFQFGCRMEPTLDSRLPDFMDVLWHSAKRPKNSIALQTNATLLHRHDPGRMRNAGLTDMQESIDTIDKGSFAALRGGADIDKIVGNLTNFVAAQPDVRVKFVVTVSTLNVDHIEDLVAFGVDLGVEHFIIREMFHIPGSGRIDDDRMAELVLAPGAFQHMADRLSERHNTDAFLNLIGTEAMLGYNDRVQKVSYPSSRGPGDAAESA